MLVLVGFANLVITVILALAGYLVFTTTGNLNTTLLVLCFTSVVLCIAGAVGTMSSWWAAEAIAVPGTALFMVAATYIGFGAWLLWGSNELLFQLLAVPVGLFA